MKKLILHLFHGLTLMVLALGVFGISVIYESNFVKTAVVQSDKQVTVMLDAAQDIELNRGEETSKAFNKTVLEVGDTVFTGEVFDSYLNFSGDGELRLDKQTRVLFSEFNEEKSHYTFKLIEGRAWLVNAYSNADVVILLDGAAAFPGQSTVYVTQEENKAYVYAHSQNTDIGILSNETQDTDELTIDSPLVINSLYLPQGTTSTIYASKVADNQETIAKLLFSKIVKEFQYSIFNKNDLITDTWLSENVSKDLKMSVRIRDERLKDIRTRGLKYSSLEASNYQLDGMFRGVYNALTFSDRKVGHRNLEALYDLLYDAQYLFDYGRTQEAEARLNSFTSLANQLFLVYGDELKQEYVDRVKEEYEYLSFANPSDSLFALRLVLQGIYLDSIKGQEEEVNMKFKFLTDDLLTLGYYAENSNIVEVNDTFKKYMNSFKDLNETYSSLLEANPNLVQRQNQMLNNIFVQYPSMYRQEFFTNKLFVENKYLSLLPPGENKYEEIQTIILQRIDFLSRLQNFFLNGQVPIVDAQNILALLFSEISKIELPDTYQVAIKQLFNERLEDFGIFYKFLSSQEYVSSTIRGGNVRERFDRFKLDNKEMIRSEEITAEIMEQASNGTNEYELGTIIEEDAEEPLLPVIDEETIIIDIDGDLSVKEHEIIVDEEASEPVKVKVPRVRPSN